MSILTKTSNNQAVAGEEPAQRIAIQGYAGSWHEAAAFGFFGNDISLDMCASFPELINSVVSGKADQAVMAIENTVAGTILPNYSLLRAAPLRIVGEAYQHISHCFMCHPGQKIEDIRTVHSHPMALLQCQIFLQKYPHIKLVEADDTAGAASELKPGQAAIASQRAAVLNELVVLAASIEDNPENFTRFLILDSEKEGIAIEAANKASLCFNLNHNIGSLAQVLLVFSAHGLNLTKIQSLPIPGHRWEYFFHIDLEFESVEQYRRACASIGHLVHELHELGLYRAFNKN